MPNNIGIIGTGNLGTQLAEFFLLKDFNVLVKTRSNEIKSSFGGAIRTRISKRNSPEITDKALKNLSVTTVFSDLRDRDFIIEAVVENETVKKEVLRDTSNACGEQTIIGSNTSSVSINNMSDVVKSPERFIGIHFFNPVAVMELVEVVIGKKTSNETIAKTTSFVTALGKTPVALGDSPGFIVNRLLLPQINEAAMLYEKGIASIEDIDKAVKLGLRHPMGPFQLADLIGIDVCVAILEKMNQDLGDDRLKPSKVLYDMISAGTLGRKTGRGFFDYSKPEKK